MYFIAYIKSMKKNIIVPKTWILDVKKHKEKFMDKGLNGNQIFICFYTNDPTAFENDVPLKDYPPNFTAPFRRDFNGPGRYKVHLKKYRSKYIFVS